ncbi:MAG TPA: GMC family oxidoreductase [Ktedonobacteraceae bacterium]|nr:GMC family oxidoreductase [Ktedonobacteraceae bacterium]
MSEKHFDAVIVGSGFGGSVMAYRLAKAGLRVCLLERGKAYPPTSFPRSPFAMKKNFWNPSNGLYGMFNVWSFEQTSSIVSSGLGGGSLIYANVLLRKDEKWFVREEPQRDGYEYWPVTLADLDSHYTNVEQMMNAQRYPFDRFPYNRTAKTIALKVAANEMHAELCMPKLAVTFGNKDEDPVPGEPIREAANLHGRTRYTCRLCGECDIGCNYGSKNTLDFTYLSRAALDYHADIRTCCEVRSFEPKDGGGYAIHYVVHDPGKYEGKKVSTHDPNILPLQTITADRLILSAGTYGSTYLLLKAKKNQKAFRGISNQLGTHFSGNGDMINFAVKCSDSAMGKREPRIIDGGYGPVITGALRFGDVVDGDGSKQRGFYIQDAGYPEFVNWMLQIFDAPGELEQAFHVALRLFEAKLEGREETDFSNYISQMFGSCELSSGLLPLLGMGRDIPNGVMHLQQDDLLQMKWKKEQAGPYYSALREKMQQISQVLGATFIDDPLWFLKRTITVHPLGGCPMGRNAAEGVVDSYGQVFCGDGVYEGLYVADGSVMPGPVGANPSLTIAALADRFADGIIKKRAGQV